MARYISKAKSVFPETSSSRSDGLVTGFMIRFFSDVTRCPWDTPGEGSFPWDTPGEDSLLSPLPLHAVKEAAKKAARHNTDSFRVDSLIISSLVLW